MKNINWTIPIIIIVGYFFLTKFFGDIGGMFKGIGAGLGIADTKDETEDLKETKELEKAMQKLKPKDNPFSIMYGKPVKVKSKFETLTNAGGNRMAKAIYDSIGTFTDSPQQAMGAIKECKYKSQISSLADYFNKKYKLDLFSFLQNKLDTTEQRIIFGRIINYVNSLPTGIQTI